MESDSYELENVTIDNLTFEEIIGAGGMGHIWRAYDHELDIPVAVKVLPPHLANDQAFLVRFLREARAIARLDHPNIVRVYQAGRKVLDGRNLRIMVMELIEGVDARALRLFEPDERIAPARAAEITLAVAKALKYAHGKGMIHRDIKPAN
ncbi:MAG: serine/threonine protein kinase, partial [Planctomycetes bacterium]|nr:serine/threonine protein kinase [Planctomycetota bacterium]